MRTSHYIQALSVAIIFGIYSPSVIAHGHGGHGEGHAKHSHAGPGHSGKSHVGKGHKGHHHDGSNDGESIRNSNPAVTGQNNRWDWNKHNWSDRRDYLQTNWVNRRSRLNAANRRHLDAQLKAQWRRFHHNQWTGPYNWEQYSDPEFLDYLHTQDPGLITTIRTKLGL